MKYDSNKGFTLIETLLYMIIVVFIVTSVVGLGISLTQTARQVEIENELNANARFVVQKLDWLLHGATGINSPAIGVHGNSLSLNTASTSLNPFVIDLSGNAIRLKVGSAAPVNITNSDVKVTSLSFDVYSFSSNTKNTIRARGSFLTVDPTIKASLSFDVFVTTR